MGQHVIAVLALQGVEVKGMACAGANFRNIYFQLVQQFTVLFGDGASAFCIGSKMTLLNPQNCRLQLIETGIHASDMTDPVILPAILT